MPEIEPEEAARRLAEGAAAISLDPSGAYRAAHPQGAVLGQPGAPRPAAGGSARGAADRSLRR